MLLIIYKYLFIKFFFILNKKSLFNNIILRFLFYKYEVCFSLYNNFINIDITIILNIILY